MKPLTPRSAASPTPEAALVLRTGLQPGQVLQRSPQGFATARLTGATRVRGPVLATISAKGRILPGWRRRRVGSADGRRFRATLARVPAGGPYALTLHAGDDDVTIPEFHVGDVWLLAGQSNMEGVGNLSGAARPHPLVRSFSLRREWELAAEPLHVPVESPDVCHHQGKPLPRAYGDEWRRTAVKGTGVGLFFGREMLRRSGVPQGLICTARGGTMMAQWSPDRRALGGESLYASLLASVRATGQPVRGVLWYQGESDADADNAPLYTARMQKFVRAVRRDLRQPRLPWLMVQIARVVSAKWDARWWNSIQDQQQRLPDKISDLAVVAAIDLPLDDAIHIGAAGYPRLARRLAQVAERHAYGRRDIPAAPRLAHVGRARQAIPGALARSAIDVEFTPPDLRLRGDSAATGFTIHSAQGELLPLIHHTTVHGPVVRLHLTEMPPVGAQVVYGYGHFPTCTLVDAHDHAVPAFRSWPWPNWTSRFVTHWRVSAEPIPDLALRDAQPRAAAAVAAVDKVYAADGFINEHPAWLDRRGVVFFTSTVAARRQLRLDVLLGYDGPLRLWINGRGVYADYAGTNPCLADQAVTTTTLAAGANEIVVAMDVSLGRAWGFFLRFAPAGESGTFSHRWAETLQFE